jgi:nucleoside-diphosphate-sugar epimerase
MHALVTGAGGFLGRHIINALIAHDVTVFALDRAFDPDLIQSWGSAVTTIVSEVHDLPDITVNLVIHAAAITALPREVDMSPEAHLRANLDPALTVLEWAAARNAGVVLFSSAAVIRNYLRPVSEFVPPEPVGVYAIAKAAMEWIAETWRFEYQRPVVCLRLSGIYGEGEIARESRPRVSLVANYIRQALTAGRIEVYHPDVARDWTYARDVGEAIWFLMQAEFGDSALYNVASEQVVTTLQVAEAVRAALPGVEIVTIKGDEPGQFPPVRRGALTNDRLLANTGFADWTPFRQGVANVVADAKRRLGGAP